MAPLLIVIGLFVGLMLLPLILMELRSEESEVSRQEASSKMWTRADEVRQEES